MRDRILNTTREQFLTYGIRSISMDDIASNLAISKKTIYKHFADKKEIVQRVTESIVEEAQLRCTKSCEDSISAIDELLKLIEFINNLFTNMNPTAMYDLEKYYPESYVLFQEHQNVFIHDHLVNNLKRGIEEGLYRDDLDVEITARLRMGQIKIAFHPEFFPPNQFELRKIQLISLDLYMMGIATTKGRELIEKFKHDNK